MDIFSTIFSFPQPFLITFIYILIQGIIFLTNSKVVSIHLTGKNRSITNKCIIIDGMRRAGFVHIFKS